MAQNTVASKGLAAPAVEAGYKGVLMLLAGLLAFAMVRHLRPAEGASQPAQRLYSIASCKRDLVQSG